MKELDLNYLKEIRRCVIGPCTGDDKLEIRKFLDEMGERLENERDWVHYNNICYYTTLRRWFSDSSEPNITPADFLKKYSNR